MVHNNFFYHAEGDSQALTVAIMDTCDYAA